MIRLGRAIDRGLYCVGRVWEDWIPLALLVVLVAAVFGLGAAIWTTVARYTGHDWHILGVYVLSEFLLLAFAPDKTKKIRDFGGEVLVWTIEEITRHSYILDLRDRMLGDALSAAQWGGGIGAGLLIGTVVVTRTVDWRKARQRRRGARAKRGGPGFRRWIGRWLKSILHLISGFLRFAWRAVTRRPRTGSTAHGEAEPAVVRHRADAATSDPAQQQRLPMPTSASAEPMIRPLAAAQSERRDQAVAAEAPLGETHLRLDQRPCHDTHEHSFGTPMPAPLPPAATASAPTAPSEPAAPSRPEPTSRKPRSSGQDPQDVHLPQGEEVAPPLTAPSQEHEAAARDDGSDDAASAAPHVERTASSDRALESSGRPRPAGIRLGARRRRRRASQDFY